jgi:type II secretory pathway predicted ATPase ExeA
VITTPPQPLAELGLGSFPFPKAPAPEAMFRWSGLGEVLARLGFALAVSGFALLTGEVGCGKSSALRLFLHGLDPNVHPAVYIADSRLSPLTLYGRVLTHFGLVAPLTSGRAREQFQALLADLATAQGKRPLLLIDEGHELSPEMVQELRYLQNVQDCDAASPFTLVLCGQPELRAMLRFRTFEAVAQRISVRCHLAPLEPHQSAAFLAHSLHQAGCDRPLFTEAAIELLHTHSRGLCRRLGNLATHALLDAALHKTPLVEEASVRRAVAELDE